MATREFVLLFVVLGLVVTVLVPHAMPQIIIKTRIEGADSLPSDKLNENLQNASLPPAGNVISVTSAEVIVRNCGTGTYAEGNASSCTSCPAGTASNVTAANSLQMCQLCSAGTWSAQTAALCSQCGVGTFSTSYGAVNSSTCRTCPIHSTSSLGTTTPLNCLCADSFFYNGNTIEPLDPLSSVQFAAWTSLTPDTVVLDTPHLACAPPSGSRRLLGFLSI